MLFVGAGVVGTLAEDPLPILRQRREGAGVALLAQPLEAVEVRRTFVAQAAQPRLETLGLRRLAVDLGDPAIAVDQVEQTFDQRVVGTCEQGVDRGDTRRSQRQALAQHGPGVAQVPGRAPVVRLVGNLLVERHFVPPARGPAATQGSLVITADAGTPRSAVATDFVRHDDRIIDETSLIISDSADSAERHAGGRGRGLERGGTLLDVPQNLRSISAARTRRAAARHVRAA